MLNVSKNRIDGKVDTSLYRSFGMLKDHSVGRLFTRLMMISFVLLLITLFLPWTQNIRSRGYITTLTPDQRPQMVHSIIGGRIEKWFVREGNFVNKGDTILFISEVKDEYFDPQLLDRTQDQIANKQESVNSYREKVGALESQLEALEDTRILKIEQAKNYVRQAELKITSDSIDFEAAKINYEIASRQLKRMEELHREGLKSLTDLESRNLKFQEAQAKVVNAENKLLTSRNMLVNAKVELGSIQNQYLDKMSKAQSDKYTALSNMYDTEAVVTKLKNQYKNYAVRSGMYYVTAPQAGFVTKSYREGIGELIKEGERLVSIMPASYDLAVSMYIRPMDLPLVTHGQEIRFMFDGWPSVVFSGWPNLSYGTFGGVVVGIDNAISPNGMYRLLVAPNPDDEPWPEGLRVGSGANGMALLKDVPIWYELWRKLNGFPPDYYKGESEASNQTTASKSEIK